MIIWVVKKCVGVVDVNVRFVAGREGRLPGRELRSAAGPVAETPV
jgi:hypothetical protein